MKQHQTNTASHRKEKAYRTTWLAT